MEKDTTEFIVHLTKPNLQVKWNKNGNQLSEDNRIKFVNEGLVYKLVIKNTQLEDADQYIITLPDGQKSKALLTVDGGFFIH